MLLGGRWQSLLFLGQCGLVVLATSGAMRRGWSISRTLAGSLMVSFWCGGLSLLAGIRHVRPIAHARTRDALL